MDTDECRLNPTFTGPTAGASVHARAFCIRGVCAPLVSAICFSFLCTASASAQSDSTALNSDFLWKQRHSPSRAALYSALIPGLGQAYNRKYWKIPIAWAGLGASYWFIQRNSSEYNRYKDAYLAVVDDDPSTVDEFNGQYSSASLLKVSDTYRRWRDLSYISFGLVYILNVMDASIDAHFVRFDVSRDLGLEIGPTLLFAGQGAPGIGIRLRL